MGMILKAQTANLAPFEYAAQWVQEGGHGPDAQLAKGELHVSRFIKAFFDGVGYHPTGPEDFTPDKVRYFHLFAVWARVDDEEAARNVRAFLKTCYNYELGISFA